MRNKEINNIRNRLSVCVQMLVILACLKRIRAICPDLTLNIKVKIIHYPGIASFINPIAMKYHC